MKNDILSKLSCSITLDFQCMGFTGRKCVYYLRETSYTHLYYTILPYWLPSRGTYYYVASIYYSIFRAAVTDTLLPAPFNMATIKRREAYALTTTLQDCIHQYIQEESVSWMANNVVYTCIQSTCNKGRSESRGSMHHVAIKQSTVHLHHCMNDKVDYKLQEI